MTLNQFNTLSEREQEIALREAVLLDDREESENTVYLFQLHGFYVEVYCHKTHPSCSRYRSFQSTAQLAPYLEKMEIRIEKLM